MDYKIVLLSIISFFFANIHCIDLTLKAKEGGHDVVSKVVAKIDASGIFKQDNSFLHRIAWSMTADGVSPDTYKKNYYGGIWQIDEANYELTKNTTQFADLTNLHEKIKLQFGIVWADTMWEDLLVPMYSGLAARLYVWTFPGDIPATLNDQADYFVDNFKFHGEKATAALFKEHSKLHDQKYKCVAKRDICFILDASGSIGTENFKKAKDFLWEIIDSMVLAENETHVSLVRYSNTPTSIFEDLYDNNTVKAKIDSMSYPGQGTYTGAAINYALDKIYPLFRVHRNQSAILPVFMVLTDGKSSDQPVVVKASQRVADLDILSISVGIGSGIDDNELLIIAHYMIEHVFYAEFNQLEGILKVLEDSTCETPAEFLYDNDEVEFELGPTQSTYVKVPLPMEGVTVKVELEDGGVTAYVSYSEATPNSAIYDEIVKPGQSKFFPYVGKSRSLLGSSFKAASNESQLFVGMTTGESEKNVFKLEVTSGDTSACSTVIPNISLLAVIALFSNLFF